MTARIQIEENGPLRVEGEFELVSEKGEKLNESGSWMKIALCRCGKSKMKPFCDKSHERESGPHQR